jgi:eukaryotic-like serine/threonine-protein kinase
MGAQRKMDLLDSLSIGTQVDSYRIEALVARGKIATIYRAVDMRDDRTVALKTPNADFEADPVLFERFQREAAIGEKLHHPGVLRVYDEVERSRVYMVMEWCEGRSLRQIMNEGKMAPDRAIRIAIAILDALDYIHNNGIVHRALNPESILVEADDKVKLIDFGYAADATARRLTFTNLTADLGTPDYISPEQVQGKRGDSRSDIYAMGVILDEMLTGKLPFNGSSPREVMNQRLLNHPIPPRVVEPSISPQLQEVIYRALERDPKNRYARAHEFARDLQHLDQVGLTDRPELRDWRKQAPHMHRRIAMYVLLLLIPLAILIAMVMTSHSK